jgi:GMP synthase (glutamine-hydrolysing)
MRPVSIALAIASLALSGCADPLEQRSGQEVQEQFGRGVTGQGTLGPMERAPDDPAAEHGVPQTHP